MPQAVFFGTELALTSSSAVSDLNSNLVGALFSQDGAADNIAEWSRPIGRAGCKSSMLRGESGDTCSYEVWPKELFRILSNQRSAPWLLSILSFFASLK